MVCPACPSSVHQEAAQFCSLISRVVSAGGGGGGGGLVCPRRLFSSSQSKCQIRSRRLSIDKCILCRTHLSSRALFFFPSFYSAPVYFFFSFPNLLGSFQGLLCHPLEDEPVLGSWIRLLLPFLYTRASFKTWRITSPPQKEEGPLLATHCVNVGRVRGRGGLGEGVHFPLVPASSCPGSQWQGVAWDLI